MKQQVLALGNFDGLHCGHMAVLHTAKRSAEKRNVRPAVLLFDRHPKEVLTGVCPPMLMTEKDKRRRLESLGFAVEVLSFEQVQSLSPAAFLALLQSAFSPSVLCCGSNYRFGAKAAGTVDTLQTLCAARKIEVCESPDVLYEGAPVSSTRIRALLETGEIKTANRMLGRPFSYCLPVVNGDRRGRELGFPTANQILPQRLVQPRYGVYASKVCLKQRWYPAVTNIGVRPTIGTADCRSETHILGFDGDLYGQELEVHLLTYLRQEENFGTLEALKEQIAADAKTAKDIFERISHETACEGRLL